MLPVPTYQVRAWLQPLRPYCLTFALGTACSVEDAVVEAAARGQRPLAALADAVVLRGDVTVAKADWATTYLHAGEDLVIKVVPGKGLVGILTTIAVIAAQFVPGLQGWTLALARVGITVAGALIQQALSPAPKQRSGGRADAESATYSITGVRNDARPYGTIPRVFGRIVNYYPPLAAAPYTETHFDNEQYLRMVFCLGYGPLSISDLKIGDTPLSEYKGISYEVKSGYSTDTALTLIPAQVREESLSIELKYASGYSIRRTEPDSDQFSIDLLFPNGLQEIQNDGDKLSLSVQFQVQYRLVGSSTWVGATYGGNVPGAGAVSTSLLNGLFVTTTGSGTGAYEVSANSKAALRRTLLVNLPARGQYDVQVRRTTIDDQSDTAGSHQSVTLETSVWSAFRSIRNDHPINAEGVALVALRAQASDQLQGVIEQFNCTVEAILPVWNGATWTNTVTRSPAWAYCEVLRGAANARPLADSRIDLDQMIAWAAVSAADGITFDGVIAERRSVFEMLQDIAGTANASPSTAQGLYTVVIDDEQTEVVQHFTPRNSHGFSSTKLFARRPHALKVRFPNEATLHQADELIVYEDGYHAGNASVFETLDLPYTTSATLAWKRARRAMFAARLRPEVYSLEVDAEHIVCQRGDLVRVTHDVPLWGVGAARVKTLATSGSDTTGVTLDAPLAMEADTDYAFRFRLSSGDSLVVPVDTVAGESATFTFTTPVATVDGPQVQDLALFGIADEESVELIVRSIEPRDDLNALLTFVDYSPDIFTADAGDIPDFDPQITLPPVVNRALPPTPAITSIDSDEDVLVRASDGTLTSRIVVGVQLVQLDGNVPAEVMQARYRHADTIEDYVWLMAIPAQAASFSIQPVDDGVAYEIQVRSVSQFGNTSPWTPVEHTVVGKTSLPPDVDRLYRQGEAITWPYPEPPIDLAGFLVRANYGTNDDWGMARALHTGIVTAPPFDIAALHGTQTLMVKAVDSSGNQSETAATVVIDLGDLYTANVIDTQSEAPGFSGVITGGTDTGTQLEASLLSSPLFWRADGGLFWGAAGDDFWAANDYDELTYTATWTPASDQLDDALLKIEATVAGAYTIDYRVSTSGAFWGAGGAAFWGAADADFWDADSIGEFTPWPGELGPFATVADSYEFCLTVAGGATQGIISQMDLIVDVPDIIEQFDSVAIAVTTGTRLTLTKTYRAIDNIQITREHDGGTGFTARFDDRQANPGAAGGPLIKVLSAAGAVVAGTVDVTIKGH